MTATTRRIPVGTDTGLQLPAVGYGTYLIPPADAATGVSTAIGLGYRHVDTAEVYGNEAAVGDGLRAGLDSTGLTRDDIVITTKLWPLGSGGRPRNRAETIAACEASLERLGLDHVDLYLIHAPMGGDARLEQWQALVQLKESGKARAVGVSNYGLDHLAEISGAGLPVPDADQVELHPWSQKPALVAHLRQQSITPIAYSSLAPLSTWRTAPGHDSAKPAQLANGDALIADLAARHGVTQAQLLLRWGIQQGYAVLPKSLDPGRMRENADLDGFEITDADMLALGALDRGAGIAWSTGDPTATS